MGQVSHNAHNRSHNPEPQGNLEFYFDVAQTVPIPPTFDVVRRPDKWVDKVHHIRNKNPENQRRRCEVASLNVPDKGGSIDDENDQG